MHGREEKDRFFLIKSLCIEEEIIKIEFVDVLNFGVKKRREI